MNRDKIMLGNFEQWVVYNPILCCATIFGSETAQHGVTVDVKGQVGHKHVTTLLYNGGLSGHAHMTPQEEKDLNEYINKKDLEMSI